MSSIKCAFLLAFGCMPMLGSITYSISDSWTDVNVGAQTASISISMPGYITSSQTIECETCGQAGQELTINDDLYMWGVEFDVTSPLSLSAKLLLSDRQYNTSGFWISSSFGEVDLQGPGTYTVNSLVSSGLDGMPLFYGTQPTSTLSINPEPSTANLALLASLLPAIVYARRVRHKSMVQHEKRRFFNMPAKKRFSFRQ